MAAKRKQWSYESMKAADDHAQSQGASLRDGEEIKNKCLCDLMLQSY